MNVIEAHNVSKRFVLHHNRGSLKERFLGLVDPSRRGEAEDFWALRDVTLQIPAGESVGLIGRNGSGKSTFLKVVSGILRATNGRLLVRRGARIGTMIELGVGFNGDLTGTENLFLNAAVHGLSRREIEAIYDQVVEYSGLGQFMDVPLKNFSSGMHMRLGFSIAVNLAPQILLLDEIFAVGDAEFQGKCIATMRRFRDEGKTLIFVSHGQASVKAICQRACLLEHGRLLFDGPVDRGFAEYDRLLSSGAARRPAPPSAEKAAASTSAVLDVTPWHRDLPGGHWAEAGWWQFEFLKREGLRPQHYVADVGCGSLSAGVHLLSYMEQDRYWGIEANRPLFEAGVKEELGRTGVAADRGHFVVNDRFDLSGVPNRFDIAIAHSLFTRMSLNGIARLLVNVGSRLAPNGRFYATWFEQPDAHDFEAMTHEGGLVTYADAEPYHYTFAVLANLCEALGLHAERVDNMGHPRGEAVMVITKRPAKGSALNGK
jgi:ABC-type polysaccharide/polyol phosphate transport system ATPase subunit